MDDGAGHAINAIVRGRYALSPINNRCIKVEMYDLLRGGLEEKNNKRIRYFDRNRVPKQEAIVTKEEGLFAFRQQVIYNVRDESDWPCLLYTARYVFDVDPLACTDDNREGNMYYLFEKRESDTRYYYGDGECRSLTQAELAKDGISFENDAQRFVELRDFPK